MLLFKYDILSETTVLSDRQYTFNSICVWQATLLLPHTLNLIEFNVCKNWDLVRVSINSSVYRDIKRQTDFKINVFFPKAFYASLCLLDVYTEVAQEPSEGHSVADGCLASCCTLVATSSITIAQEHDCPC